MFEPLIEQCKMTNADDNAYDLCVRLLAELDMTATHSYQAILTLQQELDNVNVQNPPVLNQQNFSKQPNRIQQLPIGGNHGILPHCEQFFLSFNTGLRGVVENHNMMGPHQEQ